MPFDSGIIDRIFYVRWTGMRAPGDLESILTSIASYRKALGSPIFFLNVLTESAELLSDDEPDAVDRFAYKIREHADHTYIVVEGSGFKTAATRSRITSNWRRRGEQGFASLHTSTDEALRRIATDHTMDVTALLRMAHERGLQSPAQ